MKFFLLFQFIFLTSCASFNSSAPSEGKTIYSYTDLSGKYRLVREVKTLDKKLVTRNQILLTKGSSNKIVEKSITVSQKGSVKSGGKRLLTVRPLASEFSVWLEGKQYSSKMKLDVAKKSMRVTLASPESRWNGVTLHPFPSGRFFCFYSQIPDCLYHNQLLSQGLKEKNQEYDFYIVWDNYPYLQDQLTGVGQKLFSPATLKFDGELKKRFRYIIEVEGQVILYQFSSSFDLKKISWISQGLTVVPPGEEVRDDAE